MYDESRRAFTVRGYGRASTDGQVLSTDQQEAIERDAFAAFVRSRPQWANATWGGFFADSLEHHISRDTKLRERHHGSLILAASQPGDFIIAANFDRIFANVVDVCETLELCRQRQIGLVVLDMDIDTSTILGETVFTILAAVKRMEVREIRRRVKEHIAYRKRIGRPFTGPLVGWRHKVVRRNGVVERYLKPHYAHRRLARELARIYEQPLFHNLRAASQYCNSIGLKHPSGRRWTLPTFNKWVHAAQNNFVLPNGSHEAAPIPPDAEPVLVETISADD